MSDGQRRARHARPRSRKGWVVALGLGVLVAALIGWSVNTILADTLDGDGDSSTRDRSGTLANSEPGQGEPASVQALLKECADAIDQAKQAVAAADAGVATWDTHVQARTDMLNGRISERRMEAIYDRTRAQGHVDHERFEAAQADPDILQPCDRLASAEGDAQAALVEDCVAHAEVATRALTAARDAMGEWQAHLHHMDQYEDGGMSTGTALRLWIKAWRTAPTNISAYNDARAALNSAPACSVP